MPASKKPCFLRFLLSSPIIFQSLGFTYDCKFCISVNEY